MDDKTLVPRLRILRDYLNGIGPLERKWFGDDVGRNAHPTRRFCWRKELAAITEAANTIEAQATRIEALEAALREVFIHGHSEGWRGNQMRRDVKHEDAEKSWSLYVSNGALEKTIARKALEGEQHVD